MLPRSLVVLPYWQQLAFAKPPDPTHFLCRAVASVLDWLQGLGTNAALGHDPAGERKHPPGHCNRSQLARLVSLTPRRIGGIIPAALRSFRSCTFRRVLSGMFALCSCQGVNVFLRCRDGRVRASRQLACPHMTLLGQCGVACACFFLGTY